MNEHSNTDVRPILSGRFSPPVYGFKPIETRIYRSLVAGPAQRVTAFVAPTGFGKTVLASQLHAFHQISARCFWLGLDDQPLDLTELLSRLEDLLGLATPGDTAPIMVELRTETRSRIQGIINALAPEPERDTILFLDNLNSCTDPELRLLLDALVFRAPRGLRLFMTSTRGIPFDSTQAMLEMKLRRIGPMELSFDREDTQTLLAESGLARLSEDVITHLVARSEGWPAAIRLMQVLFMEQQSPEGARLEELSSMDGDIAALLSRKLVASFPADLTRMLLGISGLRCFSAELAEATTQDPQSRAWIDYLVERNVLIVPVSADRRWWRFHALFREFLLREAERLLSEAQRRQAAARAAAWLDANGEPEHALDMALIAQDSSLSRAVLERLARPMVRDRGDLAGYLSLVARSTSAGIALGPDALFWQAWAMAFSRDYAGARAALFALREHVGQDRSDEMSRRLNLIEIIVEFHLDEVPDVLRKAPIWLEADTGPDIPDGRRFFGRAAVAAGLALSLCVYHDFPAANQAVRQVQDAITRTDSDYGKVWCAIVGATVELAQGNAQAAQDWIDVVAGKARGKLGADSSIVAVLLLVEGRIAADLGDKVRAGALIRATLSRAAQSAVLDVCWLAMEVAAECAGTAEEIVPMSELRGHAHRFSRRLTWLLDLAELRGLLRGGKIEAADDIAKRLGLNGTDDLSRDEPPMQRAYRDLVTTEYLLAKAHLAQAEAILRGALARAEADGQRAMVVELRLVQAALALRAGHGAAATTALARAIHIAARFGLARPFLVCESQTSAYVAGLKAKQLGLTQDHEIAFLRRLSDEAAPRQPDALAVDALTPRELDLLHQLAAGRSNGQIGERLNLTLPTVKWHLANIYSKLDVGNRAAALARARSLGLIT